MGRDADLRGVTVIITRPEGQAGPLRRAVEKRGGRALAFPAMTIEAVRPPSAAVRALAALRRGDWAVFTSANAVNCGLPWFPGETLPAGVRVAAVGRATASALKRRGCREVILPRGRADSEGLLERLQRHPVEDRRIVLLKGTGGRRLLAQRLRRRGALVTVVPVYRRDRPGPPHDELRRLLPERGRVVTTATSGEILHNLLHMVDARTLDRLQRSPLVVVSERVAGLARWSGFERITVARGPDPAAMADAVADAIGTV